LAQAVDSTISELSAGALVTVVLPLSSSATITNLARSNWQPLDLLNLEFNKNIFEKPVWLPHAAPINVEGYPVHDAKLFRLNSNSAFLEFSVRVPEWPSVADDQLRELFDALCRFQTLAVDNFGTGEAPHLIQWVSEHLGPDFKIAWHFTINLISLESDYRLADQSTLLSKAQNITGASSSTKEFGDYFSNKVKSIMTGETGVWIRLKDNPSRDEWEIARFWIGRLALSYSTIQRCFELLMSNRQVLLEKQEISKEEFSEFIQLKQTIVGFIFEISPGSNAGRTMDIQIYKYGYLGWDLDDDLNQMLEMLGHLESIISNFEEKRRRRESRFFTIVAGLITISGLYAVLQYLYEFWGRHGFESSIALVVDFFGALVVTSLIAMFFFWFLLKRGE
jgi:hypothetical protein